MGIGSSNVVKVKSNQNAQMCVDDLILKIDEQIKLGNIPFAIVATAGTTITGSIDPLNEIANIAKRFNLWFHVDAIYGGALIFSVEHKILLNGIELADSISFNPQKWLYVAKTCSMVLFRDFSGMVDNFRITAPYMKDQEHFINLGEITVQGSKYAEVLKLWLSLLGLGISGYQQLILHCYVLRDVFVDKAACRKYLELATNPDTNVICFRIMNSDADQCDLLNEQLQSYLLRQCGFFVSMPKFKGQNWLRVVLINPFITDEIIDELFTKIDWFVQNLN
jgi:glutamate/tyrosine decarboxylase-like PLP-dependent enzyme